MSRHILTDADRRKAHETLSQRGTRYKFTRSDCQRGYDMALLKYPMLQAKILAKIKGVEKYNGWAAFPGNPPQKGQEP